LNFHLALGQIYISGRDFVTIKIMAQSDLGRGIGKVTVSLSIVRIA
jgi:hypothetical protein